MSDVTLVWPFMAWVQECIAQVKSGGRACDPIYCLKKMHLTV